MSYNTALTHSNEKTKLRKMIFGVVLNYLCVECLIAVLGVAALI